MTTDTNPLSDNANQKIFADFILCVCVAHYSGMQNDLIVPSKQVDKSLRVEGVNKLLDFIANRQPALKKTVTLVKALMGVPSLTAKGIEKFGGILCTDFRATLLDTANEASEILSQQAAKALLADIFQIVKIDESEEGGTAHGKLAKLVVLPTISTRTVLKSYIKDVASAKNITIPALEEAVADVKTVQSQAQELAEAKTEEAVATTPAAMAKARAKKEVATKAIAETAKKSKSSKTTTQAAVAAVAGAESVADKLSREYGLTDEQKAAMMLGGKGIIAAGAGSGKTKVLSAKVKYLVEQGAKPAEIMATSFSAKSALELRERIKSLGVKSLNNRNFGTTHSIAMSLIGRQDKWGAGSKNLVVGKEQSSLVQRAMDQVKVFPTSGSPIDPPGIREARKGFFGDDIEVRELIEAEEEVEKNKRRWIQQLMHSAESIRLQHGSKPWITQDIMHLAPMLTTPMNKWTEAQKAYLEALVNKDGGRGQKMQDRLNMGRDFRNKTAALTDLDEEALLATPEKKKIVPLNMWFNRGQAKILSRRGSKAMTSKEAMLYITKCKGSLITPLQAWHFKEYSPNGEEHSVEAAIYAAYETIKGSEWSSDFDDKLIEACRVLIKKPEALAAESNGIKHILVDEAQDLNAAQHLFFGLLAGEIDPTTQTTKKDGKMRAETFCFIGDDKQAIYEFRGAEPEHFISKSKAVEPQTGEFETKFLTTNFRSKKNIVEAANRLISRNTRQIPMECKPRQNAEEGEVTYKSYATYEESASEAVTEIEKEIKGGRTLRAEDGNPRYGIAARTNAELIPYALELLSKGIKFKCPVNPLESSSYKAILSWMGFLSSRPEVREESLFSAYKTLRIPVGGRFRQLLIGMNKQRQEMLPWFLRNHHTLYATVGAAEQRELRAAMANYAAKIEMLQTMASKTPVQVLQAILNLQGMNNGKRLYETLRELIEEDDDEMSEMAFSGGDEVEEVTEGDLIAKALAVVKPLQQLLSRHTTMAGAFRALDEMKKNSERSFKKETGVSLTIGQTEPDNEYVVLDTCHGWKGLECEDIYIPMANNRFPSRVGQFPDKEEASERRLAYVAITRGKSRVRVMCPDLLLNGEDGGVSSFVTEACIPDQDSNTPPRRTSRGGARQAALEVLAEMSVLDDDLTTEELERYYGRG